MKQILLIALVLGSFVANCQTSIERKSYPKNIKKIDGVRSSYEGCTLGECYVWWILVLKNTNELLMQNGAHYPAGNKSRHIEIGTWSILSDTLYLNIYDDSFEPEYMSKTYRIVHMYGSEILIPLDQKLDLTQLIPELQLKYESSETYQEFKNIPNAELGITRYFRYFIMENYSIDYKILFSVIE